MKILLACLFPVLLTGFAVFAGETDSVRVPSVAVFDFDARGEEDDAGAVIADQLRDELTRLADGEMLGRDAIGDLSGQPPLSGEVWADQSLRNRIGRRIGAKILVSGSAFRSGDKNYLVAKVAGTETCRIFGVSANGDADFADLVPELAAKIAELLAEHAAELLPQEISAESVAARLKPELEGCGRTFHVRVTELLREPVPGPAAEPALRELLLELGFTPAATPEEADFTLTGEASAGDPGRYRQLVSAPVRLELGLYDRKGRLLGLEIQAEHAADDDYSDAVRDALRRAALNAARHLLPRTADAE